jgi:hypothetical protein
MICSLLLIVAIQKHLQTSAADNIVANGLAMFNPVACG